MKLNMLKYAAAVVLSSIVAVAAAQDIKIALIMSKTGAFEVYAKQSEYGLKLGLEYATQGTMKVLGRQVVVLYKDDQLKPDRARALTEEAYKDDGVDIVVGSTSSANTLAMMPVAEEMKKVMVVEVAGADSITGDKWNRYVVRTGPNVTMGSSGSALAVSEKGTHVATLAQDYAFGREGVAAFKRAVLKAGGNIVIEEYAPISTTDFTGPVERIFNALKDKPGKKKLWVSWIGPSPLAKINAMNPARYGIELSTLGTALPAMSALKDIPRLEGAMFYYYDMLKNPSNDWMVAEHKKRYGAPPDAGTMAGFNAGVAIIEAIKKANGTDTNKLIAAFQGLTFDSPVGPIHIRKEDHQALYGIYHVRFTTVPGVEWAVPQLIRRLPAEQMDIPILNKR
jgi:branched-chain amino acid transport system substrate-binding protein